MGTNHRHTDDWEYEFYKDKDSEYDNVLAVAYIDPTVLYTKRTGTFYEGLAPTFFHSNSGVHWGCFPEKSLGRQLTEKEAREIHPRLFERIAYDEEIDEQIAERNST